MACHNECYIPLKSPHTHRKNALRVAFSHPKRRMHDPPTGARKKDRTVFQRGGSGDLTSGLPPGGRGTAPAVEGARVYHRIQIVKTNPFLKGLEPCDKLRAMRLSSAEFQGKFCPLPRLRRAGWSVRVQEGEPTKKARRLACFPLAPPAGLEPATP